MRVRRIALEGVGRHRGVVIDRLGDGLTVVCGRNETGKSTLLAGLRGVLFGRVRASDIEVLVVPGASGRLWVEEGGVLCQVERPLARTHPPTVTLPDGRTVTGHAVLRELFPSLAPVEELLYTSVFTFQLAELTDLVDAGRVAHALYAVGLFGGKAPAEVEKDLRERAKAVYNRRSRSSALVRCLREADEVEQRLRRLDDTAEAYASLLERLERARERLRGLEEQCSEAASRLEQARKDAAAAPHHRRLRSLQAELAAYADVADWQADAQQDVLECRARLAELAAVLDAARREWTTRRQAADALQVDEAAAAALPKLQSLSDQLPEVRRRCADWRACEQAAAAAWKQAEKARNRLSGAWSEAAVQDACLSESVLAKAAAAVREAEQLDAALTEAERAWRSQQARVQAAAAAWQQRWTAVCRQAAVFCEASQEAAAALGPGAWTDAQADGERGGSAQALAAAREQCARLQAFAADWLDRAQDELHRLEEEEHDIRRQLEALTADHEAANSRRSRRGSGLPSGGRPRWAWWAALVACAVLAAVSKTQQTLPTKSS
ncbi:MAG: AAA family ATPase, partial [Alicyclobacillaceae bacterium]|nr:AAA family ATPase [Alicyclobacillaceae bacterium]